jgi:glycosyltransferase involved in cell wall biosynthesis
MTDRDGRIRVLYSFPHKLGADRICYTAWQQVNGLVAAGADVLVFPGAVRRPISGGVKIHPTLSRGTLRLPYKLLGSSRTSALHDYIVSLRIKRLRRQIDIIHTWPLGALRTLKVAAELGIPTVLERPNAHTRFAMDVVAQECKRLEVVLPPNHEHAYNAAKLQKEEEEYRLADRLLCPSDFVLRTFLEKGFPAAKLTRHQYGFDESMYYPDSKLQDRTRGLTMLFAGGCAPRKGLHYAIKAWLQSPAHLDGTFFIAGSFVPGYAEKLAPLLKHPSVRVLGHRHDMPELMRKSDILVLPTIEEGSALVTSEARGSGCVLVVSDAAGALCKHMENALVHRPGDIETLTRHITMLNQDRELMERLRAASLRTLPEITWTAAGVKLLQVYRDVLLNEQNKANSFPNA